MALWGSMLLAAVIPAFSYVTAYVASGEKAVWRDATGAPAFIERKYSTKWCVTLFQPLSKLKALVRGIDVDVSYGPSERQLFEMRVNLLPTHVEKAP